MGYLFLQKLRSVVHIQSSLFTLGYESCGLGKHCRATYQSRVNKHSSFAFELVHSNVWSPCHVLSVKGLGILFCLLMTSLTRLDFI